nr:hypothetical protein [Porphyropsis coccinea]
MQLKIYIPQHPLINHLVNLIQSVDMPPNFVKSSIVELSYWLFYEAVRDWLDTISADLEFLDGMANVQLINPELNLYAIPIFKSGLPMVEGITKLLSNITLFYVSFDFNRKTIELKNSDKLLFSKLDKNSKFLIFDSIVLSSGKILALLATLSSQGINLSSVRLIFIICTSAVLNDIGAKYPNLTVYAASVKDLKQSFQLVSYQKLQDCLFI